MGSKTIVANLKMNMNLSDVQTYLHIINESIHNDHVIICPSALYLPYFIGKDYKVGIQNISNKQKGSYTGEISASQARSMGVSYVLIGHSERRREFGENNETITEKIRLSLNENLQVILCIGESNKNDLKKEGTLIEQIKCIFDNIIPSKQIMIAYEPVWAIGSGIMPSKKQIGHIISYIKNFVYTNYHIRPFVLYGGSITEENIQDLCQIEEVDGFLIGNASVDPIAFLKIIEVAVPM